MIRAVADTHTLIWYLAGDKRLSGSARDFINKAAQNGDTIAVSPISLIEVVYLIERNRIPVNTLARLTAELIATDSVFEEVPIDHLVAVEMNQVLAAQIPDMPDRIVAATALHLRIPVISRDRRIMASSIQTIW